MIFLVYWIANPQLGHTTFWIVGSANYMWVGLIAITYFYMLIKHALNQPPSCVATIVTSILALLSGMSNESLSVAVVFISIVMVFITKLNRTISLLYVGSSITGFLILILSPGQSKRAHIDAFSDWYSLSFTERVYEHFVNRIPSIFGSLWIALIVTIITCLVVCVNFNKIRSDNASDWSKLGAVFFISALFSLAALIGAPYIPLRSTNGALILILCSLSCFLAIARKSGNEKYIFFGPLLLVVISYFSMSYYLMLSAMKGISKQNDIRNTLILAGDDKVTVPSFYMTKLMKDSDSIDYLHHSAASMQRYYSKHEIASMKVSFDYSQVIEGNNIMHNTKDDIVGVWPYQDGLSKKIVIGFNCSSLHKAESTKMSFFTHIYYNTPSGINSGFFNVDPQGEMSKFKGVCYKVYSYTKDFSPSHIGKIEYGLYSPVTGERRNMRVIIFNGI
jgi:hypothetical protein